METNIITASTGTSAWAPTGVRTLSPMSAQRQGTRLPFAPDYAAVMTDGLVSGAGTAAHKTADAAVPDPRGRKR